MDRIAKELVKIAKEIIRCKLAAKGPVQVVYEGMDAAFDIIDGMEGMMSETGEYPDQFWKFDIFHRYDNISRDYNKAARKGKFTTKELQGFINDVRDLLYDLIDGLEGVVSEQGEVPARYWKRGALKNGKKAYNALKRTRVAAATFTEFGLTYPNDSKYAKQMAHYLAPPDDDYERNQWNALRDWGKKSGASKQDMDKVLLAIDTGQANRILRHAVQSLRDVMEIADRLGIGR